MIQKPQDVGIPPTMYATSLDRAKSISFQGPHRHTFTMTVTVLILEDDAWTRSVLETALAANGFRVAAAVGTARDAMSAADTTDIDVAILDLDLGDGPTGVDVTIALGRRHPDVGIVLLTSYEDLRLFKSALPKLPDSVHVARKSEVTDVQQLVEYVRQAKEKVPPTRRLMTELTDPQIETLRLVAAGLTNAQIAKERFVTEKAIEHAIARLARQLDIPQESSQNTRVLLTRAYFKMIGHRSAG